MKLVKEAGGNRAAAPAVFREMSEATVVAVPGGSSPLPLFAFWRGEALAGRGFPGKNGIILEADERVVPPEHPDSNARLIREHLTRGVPELERAFRPFPKDADPAAFAETLPRISVTLLGLGEDGHVASLFPGRPEDWERKEGAFYTESPAHPHRRITLSFARINGGGSIILLAFGENKREALTRLLDRDPSIPASRLDPDKLLLFTDLL